MASRHKRTTGRDAERFPVNETKLRGWLGVSKDLCKSRREKHLTEGVDWVLDWRQIYYSNEGVAKMYRAFGLEQKVEISLPEEAMVEQVEAVSEPEVVQSEPVKQELPPDTATVTKLFPNRRLVGARLGDREVMVRVRDSRELRRGFGLLVKWEREPNWYVCVKALRRVPITQA
jgi:hypothetical protein